MTDWFVQGSEDERGPFRPSELLEMVRRGEVKPETMIRKNDSAWFEASAVGGLFEAAMRPTIEYFCPTCDAPVRQPPCNCRQCGREVHRARTRITEHTIMSEEEQHLSSQATRSVQKWLSRVRGRKPQ
jgi:hypothetical protein